MWDEQQMKSNVFVSVCRFPPCKQQIENFLIVMFLVNGMAKSGFVPSSPNERRKLRRQRIGREKDGKECNCLPSDVPVYLILIQEIVSRSFSSSDGTVLTLSGRMIHLIDMVSWSGIYCP